MQVGASFVQLARNANVQLVFFYGSTWCKRHFEKDGGHFCSSANRLLPSGEFENDKQQRFFLDEH